MVVVEDHVEVMAPSFTSFEVARRGGLPIRFVAVMEALADYQRRERRFGKISEQLAKEA